MSINPFAGIATVAAIPATMLIQQVTGPHSLSDTVLLAGQLVAIAGAFFTVRANLTALRKEFDDFKTEVRSYDISALRQKIEDLEKRLDRKDA